MKRTVQKIKNKQLKKSETFLRRPYEKRLKKAFDRTRAKKIVFALSNLYISSLC